MDSEAIVQKIYNKIISFLEGVLERSKFNIVLQQVNKTFPTWEYAWRTIHGWLQEHPLTNMQNSIHSFAKLFPNYESFKPQLENSLYLHDEFWNQVHTDLCIAKIKL